MSGETVVVTTTIAAKASVRRVLTLTVVDQGASSISNFALALVVAHYSGARALGIFAIVTTTYILGQGLVRSLTSDCLLTRSETDTGLLEDYEHAGYGAAFVASSVLSLGILYASPFLNRAFAVPLVIFALSFPLMALQDFSRFIAINRRDPAYAIRLDIGWLVLFVVAFFVLRSQHLLSLPWLWGAWTIAGAVVGLTTVSAHLMARRYRQLLGFWMHSERAVGIRFAGQFVLTTSWLYLIFYLLAFVISLGALGSVKLAQLAIAPLTVMAAGLQAALISITSKRFERNPKRAVQFLLVAGLCIAVLTAAWTGLFYAAPSHLVTKIFGPTWPAARGLVPYIGLGFALSGLAGAATAGLRALRAATANLWLAVVMVPFFFVPTIGGAAYWGARGFSIGLVVATGIYAVLGWTVLVRTVSRTALGRATVGPTPDMRRAMAADRAGRHGTGLAAPRASAGQGV